MKNNFLNTVLLLMGLFLLTGIFNQAGAATLNLSPSTVNTSVGQTFELSVTVDAGSDEINGTDIYVVFDGAVIEAQSVSSGSFFPVVQNTITSGQVYIAGMVEDAASYKSGSGTVATIVFKGLKDGSASISFDCNQSTVIKNVANATNVLDCTSSGSSSVTVGSGTSGDNTTPSGDADSPKELPQSGVFENVVKWSVPGTILLILGVFSRVLL